MYLTGFNLKDNSSVQLNYNSVSQDLYEKFKRYIKDLASKRWIVHLNLSYPSLLVVFKKKRDLQDCAVTTERLTLRHYLIDILSPVSKVSLTVLVKISISHFWIKAVCLTNYT